MMAPCIDALMLTLVAWIAITQLRDILLDKQMSDLAAELPAPAISATTASRAPSRQIRDADVGRTKPSPAVEVVVKKTEEVRLSGESSAGHDDLSHTVQVQREDTAVKALGLYAAYGSLFNAGGNAAGQSNSHYDNSSSQPHVHDLANLMLSYSELSSKR